MSENGATPAEGQQQPQVQMNILGQFVRDLSFENVMAQRGGTGEVNPDISVQVNLDAKKREADHQFEVMIKLTAEGEDSRHVLPYRKGCATSLERI